MYRDACFINTNRLLSFPLDEEMHLTIHWQTFASKLIPLVLLEKDNSSCFMISYCPHCMYCHMNTSLNIQENGKYFCSTNWYLFLWLTINHLNLVHFFRGGREGVNHSIHILFSLSSSLQMFSAVLTVLSLTAILSNRRRVFTIRWRCRLDWSCRLVVVMVSNVCEASRL